MKKVIVGSNNPVKLETTKEAFLKVFPLEQFEFVTHPAKSGVPDQPFGTEETRRGAKNRCDDCKSRYPEADYYIGLEGGLEEIDGGLWVSAWMCIQNQAGTYGYGRTGSFLLPPGITTLIKQGKELGDATDIVFQQSNTKHNTGAVGLLTLDLISRKDFYRDAIIFALIPFINVSLYTYK